MSTDRWPHFRLYLRWLVSRWAGGRTPCCLFAVEPSGHSPRGEEYMKVLLFACKLSHSYVDYKVDPVPAFHCPPLQYYHIDHLTALSQPTPHDEHKYRLQFIRPCVQTR